MIRPAKKTFRNLLAPALAAAITTVASLTGLAATTNTFDFNNTTVSSGSGPVNPANGATAISGANLVAGSVVVFDAVVVAVPGGTGDAWAAVELNAGGYLGLTSATLGLLAESGTASGNGWQLFINGGSTPFGSSGLDAHTNRVHIELDCTETDSTTNMTYLVEIDQGLTGTFNASLTGTGLTFPGNTIPLEFGANNSAYLIIQTQPIIAVSAPTPLVNTVIPGLTATFAATLTQGYPLQTAQQWLSNGVPIVGATNLTYTTPPVTASYNGAQYNIVVTNLLTAGNIVTSSVASLVVRTTPGIVQLSFPTTTIAGNGGGLVVTPGVSINGSGLLAGDTVVFDGIIIPSGAQNSDAWTAVDIAGAGYGNVTGAKLGVLVRNGSGANPSQLFINGSGGANPTPGSAATNRVRIELFPSASGTTTNMGWLVEIDQNLTGVFVPAVSGTNLTFAGNTLPLTFGSSGSGAIIYQNPQSPVSIFSGPSPSSQVVAVGTPISVGVTVEGWSPAFQWRKNGVIIPNATNEDYTSAPATLADNGDQFTVVVSNQLSSANVVTSTVASVAVLIPNNVSWYPTADFTTWDTKTPNWSTNGGISQTTFVTGNNVTFDSLGYNIGGSTVDVTNAVNPNGVTVNASASDTYVFDGSGAISGESLLLTGDGTGTLGLELPGGASFASVTVTAFGGSPATNTLLAVGDNGVDSAFDAGIITNNGVIEFNNAAGVLGVTATITGSGSIIQNGTGTTVLSATNSSIAIQSINAGVLSIASTPMPGVIENDSVLEPASAASVLAIPNVINGGGYYNFVGFQTTIVTGESTFTGENLLFWSEVIVDNPQALGDANAGFSDVSGADRFGGLYLSNNIVWSQPIELDTRYDTGVAATAPHIANWSGTNDVTAPISFDTGTAAGVSGSEINVEATTGQLTIDASTTVANDIGNSPADLNLQGAGQGFWNTALSDSGSGVPLNLLMRGAGVWTLGAANSYSGTTTVGSGTLLVTGQIGSGGVSVNAGGTLGGNGTIGGPVAVAAGGTLEVLPGSGVGTLTVNNSVTLSPESFTSLQIDKTAKTEDQISGVTALTYGGTLVITNLAGTLTTSDTFPLFSAGSYSGTFASIIPASPGAGLSWNTSTLAVDGTLRIATGGGPATNPTNITAVLNGSVLTLSWPANHLGWRLLVQTNNLSAGLSANPADWAAVPGSASVDSTNITINPALPAEFYQLVYP